LKSLLQILIALIECLKIKMVKNVNAEGY